MTVLWTSADLLAATGGRMRTPFSADAVSIDSRTIEPGALFVALATESGDGHAFVADALAQGAAGAMVHRLPDGLGDDAPLLHVPDTLAGLHALGAFARARFAGQVVAITGSVGKTTTKEMLRAIFRLSGRPGPPKPRITITGACRSPWRACPPKPRSASSKSA